MSQAQGVTEAALAALSVVLPQQSTVTRKCLVQVDPDCVGQVSSASIKVVDQVPNPDYMQLGETE